MRPDHHRVAVDRHAGAEVVTRSAVVRGQLVQPASSRRRGHRRVTREHVRGPAVWIPCRRPVRPDHHRVAVDRHALPKQSLAAPSSAVSFGNLRPAGGEVAGRVAREHVRGPAVGSLVVVLSPRPPPCRRRSTRWSRTSHPQRRRRASALATLRPAGGEVAGCVTREHVRGPAVGVPCRRPIRPDHHRVAVDRDAGPKLSSQRRRRGQLVATLRPAGGEVAGCVAREHVRGPAGGSRRPYAPTTIVSPSIDTLLPK